MPDVVVHWVGQYGYPALYVLLLLGIVGLPVPDETLLTFAGYLVFSGRMEPIPALVACVLGSWSGITLSYGIGRIPGAGFVRRFGPRFGLTPARLRSTWRWFNRLGKWALAVCYYIPAVRHFMAIVAGTAGLDWKTFALFAYSGAVAWCLTFLSLGYLLGENWHRLPLSETHLLVLLALLAAVALAGRFLWRRRKRR